MLPRAPPDPPLKPLPGHQDIAIYPLVNPTMAKQALLEIMKQVWNRGLGEAWGLLGSGAGPIRHMCACRSLRRPEDSLQRSAARERASSTWPPSRRLNSCTGRSRRQRHPLPSPSPPTRQKADIIIDETYFIRPTNAPSIDALLARYRSASRSDVVVSYSEVANFPAFSQSKARAHGVPR